MLWRCDMEFARIVGPRLEDRCTMAIREQRLIYTSDLYPSGATWRKQGRFYVVPGTMGSMQLVLGSIKQQSRHTTS